MNAVRRYMLALAMIAVAAPAARAQSAGFPRVELAAAYSRLPADGDDFPRPDSNGIHVGVAGNLTRWFGLVGDLSWYRGNNPRARSPLGVTGAETTVRMALVGARFTARGPRVNVFTHGLFGTATGDAGPGFGGFSDSGVTFGGGGGIDLHLDERFAARAQFDWIGSFADIVEANFRMSVGGVVRF